FSEVAAKTIDLSCQIVRPTYRREKFALACHWVLAIGFAWERRNQPSCPAENLGQFFQSVPDLCGQHLRLIAPTPVAAGFCGQIHARLAAEPQQILKRNNSDVSDRRQGTTNESPIDLVAVTAQVLQSERPFSVNFLRRASAVLGT